MVQRWNSLLHNEQLYHNTSSVNTMI
jgi:hypothetical protein